MRAERVGSETVLAQIVRMVAEAQRTRAPIQRLADAVAAWFVPAVVVVALLSFAGWFIWGPEPRLAFALLSAISVLIIACPCALGLATPMAIMVGTGRGASAGVLIKNAEALERFESVDTVVVDKTGTLTEGRPRVTEIRVVEPFTEIDVLKFAAGLEQASEHPLATAVVEAARARGLKRSAVSGFAALAGLGVTGSVEKRAVLVGSAALLRERGVQVSALEGLTEAARGGGRSAVFVAIDGQPAGAMIVEDPIKPTTKDAIQSLHREGVRIVMLTGDVRATAQAVADAVGIDEVIAEVRPDEKRDVIERLQREGELWRWRGMASTMPRRWRRRRSVSRWGLAPTSQSRAPASRSSGEISRAGARAQLEPRHDEEYPAEPVPGVRLQRRRRARGRRRALSAARRADQPDLGERGDDVQLGVRHRQRAEAEKR